MILKIIIKKNKKKNLCIIITKKHKILNVIGILKNNYLYLDFIKLKYYLLLGCTISSRVKNLLYKNFKKNLLLKNNI